MSTFNKITFSIIVFTFLNFSDDLLISQVNAQDGIERESNTDIRSKKPIEKNKERKIIIQKERREELNEQEEGIRETREELRESIEELKEEIRNTDSPAVLNALQKAQKQLENVLRELDRRESNIPPIPPASPIPPDSEESEIKEIDSDSTVISLGKKRIIIEQKDSKPKIKIQKFNEEETDRIEKKEDIDDDKGNSPFKKWKGSRNVSVNFIGLDLGFNALMQNGSLNLTAPYSDFELRQAPSLNVTLRFMKTRFNLIKNHVHFITGLEFDFLNYKFNRGITFTPRQSEFSYTIDTTSKFNVNKLSATYFQIPLLLHFTAKNRKIKNALRASVGGFAGFRIASWTKQEQSNGQTLINDDRFHLDNFRYGLSFRVGFSFLELYMNYTLPPLFRTQEKGPDLNSVCFGIRLFEF